MKSLASQMEFILELTTEESKYSATFQFIFWLYIYILIQVQPIHLCLLLHSGRAWALRSVHGIQQRYILKNYLRDVVTMAGF